MTDITIIPLKHPILISFPEQSDYENNKTRIKRIIKTKHKLNKFVFATGEWFNENDTEKSIVVKRFTDEKGYTNALQFKGSQQLVEDVKALLDSLKINYEEKEVSEQEIQEQETEQELPKPEATTPPIASKAPSVELTPEEILKLHKETETFAFKNYSTGRITGYNAEIDKKVRLGQLDEERANKMKEEFSGKMDGFIQKWSEAGDKWLKEKLAELCFKEVELEDDFEVSEKPKKVEPIKEKKKARKKVKKL
ncbi:hypothetical protein A2Z22_02005 [Candidatus Woesebacteria bacterium RBG_16_34_12]|uniref:Uncharacterized protein n=1 Tax=Candidatus Woesebacteria bacterium RBG_16_34_12 TaxID=1802480 RepID=A0A1F7X9I4_9BACT|nr:MAG: hypothetical protein A2Z22_02005 [Candidatus Woesebacteria bacterium RBG_16_34_12]